MPAIRTLKGRLCYNPLDWTSLTAIGLIEQVDGKAILTSFGPKMNTDGGPPIPGSFPIATQATPIGRGSISTLLLDGPGILPRIQPMFRPASQRPLQTPSAATGSPAADQRSVQEGSDQGIVRFGHWNHDPNRSSETDVNAWEEVVISISNSIPRSEGTTSSTHIERTRIEVQCHGGDRAANSILKSLESAGFRILTWAEWLTQNESAFESEYTESLAKSTTHRTALLLLRQGRQAGGELGLIEREIHRITNQLIEAESTEPEELGRRLRDLISNGRIGQHLTIPWQIAVVGEPNVGKSSLVNALVGFQRAIVYDQPGTTRDELETSVALEGWPMQLWDTAGLRETTNEIEGEGIARATERLKQSDLIVHVCDARDASQPTAENHFLETIEQHANVLVVWNKIDLLSGTRLPNQSRRAVKTSATQGTGLDDLKNQIVNALIRESIDSQTALLFTPRQVSLAEQAIAYYESGQKSDAIERLAAIMR